MQELDGKVAVVTGTAQGIGQAIARTLRAAGATVHEVDRDTVDLSVTAQVEEFFASVGDVDVLVNNAGGVTGQTHVPIDELTDAAWDAVVDANLRTTMNCTRAAARTMKRRGYGRIVVISSGAGRSVSLTGIQAYASAKAAQIGFTRQMAHELGPHGITVNCQAALLERIAVRATGTPEDIARGVLFFAVPAAGWVSGQTLSIDGGHSLF
jgi:3-oxoacyl-[acyl-carrier protein] reductase